MTLVEVKNLSKTYGDPSAGLRRAQSSRSGRGVVPQDIALYPDLNAVENLRFFGRMCDVPKAKLDCCAIGWRQRLPGLSFRAILTTG